MILETFSKSVSFEDYDPRNFLGIRDLFEGYETSKSRETRRNLETLKTYPNFEKLSPLKKAPKFRKEFLETLAMGNPSPARPPSRPRYASHIRACAGYHCSDITTTHILLILNEQQSDNQRKAAEFIPCKACGIWRGQSYLIQPRGSDAHR